MTDGCSAHFWGYGTYSSAGVLLKTCSLDSVMYSRYAASEGKNLSDAIGAILKRVIRNKILKQKGTEETVIEMGMDLEDTQFKNYNDVDWLKVQIRLQGIKGFDKFKSFSYCSEGA